MDEANREKAEKKKKNEQLKALEAQLKAMKAQVNKGKKIQPKKPDAEDEDEHADELIGFTLAQKGDKTPTRKEKKEKKGVDDANLFGKVNTEE